MGSIAEPSPREPQSDPFTFTIGRLLLESYETNANTIPIVARRELHRGSDKNAYVHQDFWALYFVRRGRGTHVVDGHAWSMARGNIYLLTPGSAHFYGGETDVVLDAVYFGEALFSSDEHLALGELSGAEPVVARMVRDSEDGRDGRVSLPGHFLHLPPHRQIEAEATITQIRNDRARPERALHLSAKSRLWCLIVELAIWRAEAPSPTRGGESRELADVLEFCEAHFSRDLTVEKLAAATHFSRNHFTRLFTQEVGMPPASYLRHLRMQHAQKLLRETMHSIADIAPMCGFSDATSFSRAFQKSFAASPGSYRIAYRRTTKGQKA